MSNNRDKFWAKVFGKLKKNKVFLVASGFVFFLFLLSIFAYCIIPDNTEYADRQCLEIQAKPIGYKQNFLKVYTPETLEKKSFFSGNISNYKLIPIESYKLNNKTIEVQKRVDDDTTITQFYNLDSISLPTSSKNDIIVTKKFYLGTDKFGRDLLSRLVLGTRVSLTAGFIAVVISLIVGIVLGALAGYFMGKTDAVIMWFLNVIWAIPTVLLVFAISVLFKNKDVLWVYVSIGLTTWISVARLVRGQTMSIKELDYIQAAKAMGYSHWRIIFKHILPNILGPLLVIAASNFATAIILEAGLSFLGFGVQPPQPSWGLMIKENYNFIITNKPFLALVPGFAIMLLVLAINLIGNALRDALDVKA